MRHFQHLLESHWSQSRFVCVGLDSELSKLPASALHYDQEGNVDSAASLIAFNRAIIEATHDLVCAYKPNTAFYEAYGIAGMVALEKTISLIHEIAPTVPVILDAKRADIGNTNNGTVTFAFDYLKADAITLHPYLGKEALEPFLARKEKGAIILCKTSNVGSDEFQNLIVNRLFSKLADDDEGQGTPAHRPAVYKEVPEDANTGVTLSFAPAVEFRKKSDEEPLYKIVARRVAEEWNANGNCGLVVGATYPKEIEAVRKIAPNMPLLIPGIGAQGGSVEQTVAAARTQQGTRMIINSSRGIIFASCEEDFAEAARCETEKLHQLIQKANS
ncbi:MAG: orotidine-5'-phosphate decarboxylase [Chthoniobacterales bacterium]